MHGQWRAPLAHVAPIKGTHFRLHLQGRWRNKEAQWRQLYCLSGSCDFQPHSTREFSNLQWLNTTEIKPGTRKRENISHGKQQVNNLEDRTPILPPWGFPSHSMAVPQRSGHMQSVGQRSELGTWEQHDCASRWDKELARAGCQGTTWGCSSFRSSLVTCTQVLHCAFSQLKGMRRLLNTVWFVAQKATWLEDSPSPVLLPQECKHPEGTDLIPSHTSWTVIAIDLLLHRWAPW